MWIITRNHYQALANDGTWAFRNNTDDLKIFPSYKLAEEWIETESLPEEFVSVTNLVSLLAESHRQNEKVRKRERNRLRKCQYIALDAPEKFYGSSDAEDGWPYPVFDWIMVTHVVVDEGLVIGVLGKTSDSAMPFYCYTSDEYYYTFDDCYTRQEPDRTRHSFIEDGF